MARRRPGREIHGILLLDKALGVSSNGALQEIKRLFQAQKAGHTGSLDPLATGLLPICFGEATKISAFLLETDKRYRVKVQLGIVTDTADAEGDILQRSSVPALSETLLNEVLSRFTGDITQVPPMHSAVKHGGQRLYELARRGIEVERQPRQVHIHELRLLGTTETALELDVLCSKGTYIRTLAEDIGRALGCGGSVLQLRRTAVGSFDVADALTAERLRAMGGDAERLDCLLPVDAGLGSLPAVALTAEQFYFVEKGQAVFMPKGPLAGHVRLYDEGGRLIGIGEMLDDGKLAPRRQLRVD